MEDLKCSLTVSLIDDSEGEVVPIDEGEIVPVEDDEILRFRVELKLTSGVKRIIYAPQTLVAMLSVNWYYEKPLILARLENGNALLEYVGETELEARHEWFVISKIQPLSISYPGKDSIIAIRQRWRKLGRLGWLSDFEETVSIPKLSAYAYLAKREVV